MLHPFSQHDQSRPVSTSADSVSTASTIKPADSARRTPGKRFVSAPLASPPAAQLNSEMIGRESFSYTRETAAQLDALGENDARSMTRWSNSSGSPSGSPRLHKRDSSITKRFSLRGPAFSSGIYQETQRSGSPSKQLFNGVRQVFQREPSPTRQPSVLGRIASRRAASGAEGQHSPKRPPLVSNVSSPSILGLSSRTIDTYRRETSQTTGTTHQPRTLPLFYGGRSDPAPGMAETLQSRTNHQNRSPTRKGQSEASQQSTMEGKVQRTKSAGSKQKKSMLSRALKRANDAVGLDNAQDYAGAVKAYEEACESLKEVMRHSSNNEDREKLQQIRGTYASRIHELQIADAAWQPSGGLPNESVSSIRTPPFDKDLPALPPTSDIEKSTTSARVSQKLTSESLGTFWPEEDYDMSFPAQAPEDISFASDATEPEPETMEHRLVATTVPHAMPSYGPAPIRELQSDLHRPPDSSRATTLMHEGTAWPTTPSPIHSPTFHTPQRDPNRPRDSDTEAAFNAALDAAVEAVYDEGYEPYQDEAGPDFDGGASARTLIAEPSSTREAAIAAATARMSGGYSALGLGGENMEEEERLLEEITRDFMLDNHALDEEAKTVMPRQSDSSTSSSAHTWDSSAASSVHTSGTTLSPVHEKSGLGYPGMLLSGIPPVGPPPINTLPPLPMPSMSRSPGTMTLDASSVQDRRLSSSRRLQIRTAVENRPSSRGKPTSAISSHLGMEDPFASLSSAVSADAAFPASALKQSASSSLSRGSASIVSTLTVPPTALSDRSGISTPLSSPTGVLTVNGNRRPSISRQDTNVSTKLNNLRPFPSAASTTALETPSSLGFSAGSATSTRFPAHSLPFAASAVSPPLAPGQPDIFTDIHTQGRQRQSSSDMPRPLEPCPETVLLRPFWLLRCVYQTIAHPRGGYISTRLFIPRDIWKTQGVKIKSVEEKIAACDQMTSALVRLRKVNTIDADAVLNELQQLENLMDQVQATLSKKLGSEVGTKDLSSSFKDAPPSSFVSFDGSTTSVPQEGAPNTLSTGSTTSTTNKSGKSYFSSLGRKLRNKPSHTSLATAASFTFTAASTATLVANGPYELPSVPMTSTAINPRSNFRSTTLTPPLNPRDSLTAPYAAYTFSLAKLCDAAQVLDEIVRQAEDPGTKAQGKTHVGLELGARHASEFFGLWVCRWVLADLGMLVDKGIKRRGEWVME